jgi:hypothetical protein
MAHQMMLYRLTAEGTIPDFLYLGDDGVGGVYGVLDNSVAGPQNLVQVGITKNNAIGDFEIFETKSNLLSYLLIVGANWTQNDPNNIEVQIPFDQNAATDWAWGRLDALNAQYNH